MRMVLPKKAGRCMGQCCEEFLVLLGGKAVGIAEVREEMERGWGRKDGNWSEQQQEDFRGFVERLVLIDSAPGTAQRYSCGAFDAVERKCRIYQERPGVCRRYGTAEVPCEHPHCQWEDAVRKTPQTSSDKGGRVDREGDGRGEA